MYIKAFVISFFCFICYSCKDGDQSKDIKLHSNMREGDSTLTVAMKKFGLEHPQQNYSADSNSLFFYRLQSSDSSFLIHLKWEEKVANGEYYLELPPNYNINDSGNLKNRVSFFQGCRFTLDSVTWEIIKTKADKFLKDTTFKNSFGCRDCALYGLSFNSNSKIDNGVKYEAFNNFLNELFLEKFHSQMENSSILHDK